VKYLASKPAIADRLTAEKFGTRIFLRRAPQGCPLPLAVVSVFGGSPDYHLAGELGDTSRVVQVSVYAATDREAEDIAELIRLAPLSGYRGQMDTVRVQAVVIESEIDRLVESASGGDEPYFETTKDYRIHFDRAVN
jgi:hypothetical protein